MNLHHLLACTESGLLSYKHIVPWADSVLNSPRKEPIWWICDLSITKYTPKIIKIIRMAIDEKDNSSYDTVELNVFYCHCLYYRYLRREWSWASFLLELGKYCDPDGPIEPEIPYSLLNEYEDSHFSSNLEKSQLPELSKHITLQSTYKPLDNFLIEINAAN